MLQIKMEQGVTPFSLYPQYCIPSPGCSFSIIHRVFEGLIPLQSIPYANYNPVDRLEFRR